MVTVRNQRVIAKLGDRYVVAAGIEVQAGQDPVMVHDVGWVTGDGTEVCVRPADDENLVALPYRLGSYESARWILSPERMRSQITDAAGATSPALRASAIVDGRQMRACDQIDVDGTSLTEQQNHLADDGASSACTDDSFFHDLRRREERRSSQNGEDGVIAAIFEEIGVTNRFVVEFGCGDATECNSAQLLERGWSALLMDPFHRSANPLVEISPDFVTAENIDGLLRRHEVPDEFDLLSIDIDGNDYWVWRQILHRPRVVVIEYNAHVSAHLARAIPYDASFQFGVTDFFGASLRALQILGSSKGYELVHCERTGTNAFFVARECLPPRFVPRPVEDVYQRPNYLGLGLAYRHDPVPLVEPAV